jgi:hypothetical protein
MTECREGRPQVPRLCCNSVGKMMKRSKAATNVQQQVAVVRLAGSWLWCGVVWCGVVWCGVVWCGVAWCGGPACLALARVNLQDRQAGGGDQGSHVLGQAGCGEEHNDLVVWQERRKEEESRVRRVEAKSSARKIRSRTVGSDGDGQQC